MHNFCERSRLLGSGDGIEDAQKKEGREKERKGKRN